MKTRLLILLVFMALVLPFGRMAAQGLDSLALRNVDSSMVSLKTFDDKKALVLVFTGNHCVYSKKYEDRIIRIAQEFMAQGIGFCLVNSNDPNMSQDDRWVLMRDRAKEKNYPCPYLHDPEAKLAHAIGATKNPEVFVLRKQEKAWSILYSGKIDDNPLIEDKVQRQFLVEELNRVVKGDFAPATAEPAVGCSIKSKE
ncbi:MAG: redoxin family protein [Bacteroidia bacterium]